MIFGHCFLFLSGYIFPQPPVFFSHISISHLSIFSWIFRRSPLRSVEFFFCAFPSSLVFCLVKSSHLVLPWLVAQFFGVFVVVDVVFIQRVCQTLPEFLLCAPYPGISHVSKMDKFLTGFVFYLSGITILYYLLSSGLKIIASCFVLFCFKK